MITPTQLDALAQTLTLVAGPVQPGLIRIQISPDPATLTLNDPTQEAGQTVTGFLKFVRFADEALPANGVDVSQYLAQVGNVLGGQLMQAIQVPLPGPALPGAQLPVSQVQIDTRQTGSTLGDIHADVSVDSPVVGPPAGGALPVRPQLGDITGKTDKIHDLLAGVPGIVAQFETKVSNVLPLSVSATIVWKLRLVNDGNWISLQAGPAASVEFLPTPLFSRLGPPVPSDEYEIEADVTLSVGTVQTTTPHALSLRVNIPRIPVPLLGGLFTWRSYGTQSSEGDTSPDDSSLLLMIPSDSPVSTVDSITSALSNLTDTLHTLRGALASPLDGVLTLLDSTEVTNIVGNLDASVTGIGIMLAALHYSVPGHPDFQPVTLARGAKDSGSDLGEISDISVFYFDVEEAGLGHDRYHDHAKSALLIGKPDSQLELDYEKSFDGRQAQLTLTAGPALFVGVRDFKHAADTTDPMSGSTSPSHAEKLYEHTYSMKFVAG